MNNYCIYRHISPSMKVYIGITCRKPKYRWNNGRGYKETDQPLFYRAIKKYGWNNFKHEVLFRDLPEIKAKNLEKALIRHYKNLGLSYNITDGGDGALGAGYTHTGWKHSEKTKKNFSEQRKGTKVGNKNPMYGRHLTNPAYGKIGKDHPASKKVIQFTKEGNFIREWDSISDVYRDLKIIPTNITAVCRGRAKSAGGFKWKYK